MITNNNSWSLGSTPNKSLETIGPSIPNHPPGGRTEAGKPGSQTDPGDTAADSLSRVLPLSGAVHSHSVAHPRSTRHLVATSLSRTAHSLSFHNPTSLCRHVATSLSCGPDRSDRFLNFDLSQPLFPETLNLKP